MFGVSLIVLAGMAFLAVVTGALVLFISRGKGGEGVGCCAGCGLAGLLLLGLVAGVGVVAALTSREHHRHWEHRVRDHESLRLNRTLERAKRVAEEKAEQFERRLEREAEALEDTLERRIERLEEEIEQLEERLRQARDR